MHAPSRPLKQLRPIQTRDWVGEISTAWSSVLKGIFTTGDLLVAAKASLAHGAFEAMVRSQLPFNERTAQRLMAIAADNRLRKASRASLLPRSWTTLYELSRLDDATLERALSDGTVSPKLTREEAEGLRRPASTPAQWPRSNLSSPEAQQRGAAMLARGNTKIAAMKEAALVKKVRRKSRPDDSASMPHRWADLTLAIEPDTVNLLPHDERHKLAEKLREILEYLNRTIN